MSDPKSGRSGGSKLTPERQEKMAKAAMGEELNKNELDLLSEKVEIDELKKLCLDKIKEKDDIINELRRQNKQLNFQNNLLLNAGTKNSEVGKQMINQMEEMKKMEELDYKIRNDSNRVKLENEQLKLENEQLQYLINKNCPPLSSGTSGKFALRIL